MKQISRAIGNELDDQAVLIDSLSAEVDSAHGRMNATIAKIQRFSRYKCLKPRPGVDKMIWKNKTLHFTTNFNSTSLGKSFCRPLITSPLDLLHFIGTLTLRRIRLSTDRRQWYAIGGLAVLIFILILLLFS